MFELQTQFNTSTYLQHSWHRNWFGTNQSLQVTNTETSVESGVQGLNFMTEQYVQVQVVQFNLMTLTHLSTDGFSIS